MKHETLVSMRETTPSEALKEIQKINEEMAPSLRKYSEKAGRVLELSKVVWEDTLRATFPEARFIEAVPVTAIPVQQTPTQAVQILSHQLPDGVALADVEIRLVLFNPLNQTFSLFTSDTILK